MFYSDIYLSKARKVSLPVLVTLIVFSFSVIFFTKTVFLVSNHATRASNVQLRRVEIVNVSYNSFDVFWQTNDEEKGWILYGNNKNMLNKIALDIRDTHSIRKKFRFHLAKIEGDTGLKSDTTYYFKIVSSEKVYTLPNQESFSFKTPPLFNLKIGEEFAYGKILNSKGDPLSNAFVIFRSNDTYPYLAVTKNTGEWFINLSNIVSRIKREPVDLTDNQKIKLEILSEDNKKSVVTSDIDNIKPLPQAIVIGKDYDFISPPSVLSASDSKYTNYKSNNLKVDILYPKEGAILPGAPLIKGTGVPGETVLITIHSKTYVAKVKVNKKGVWLLKIPVHLSSGSHEISISTKDYSGHSVQLIRNFVIGKSGESVLGEATGSATYTPTPSPTPSDTATSPTLTPTPTTVSTNLSPTPTQSSQGTAQPSPTKKSSVPTQSPPVTGFNLNHLLTAGGLLIVTGVGLLIAF